MATDLEPELVALRDGPEHWFRDWPNEAVPLVAAGVYSVWDGEVLIYAGMAGRSLTADAIVEHQAVPGRRTGLHSRLNSHASGRRSGDLCVYVCDRLVLPTLSTSDLAQIGQGELSLDRLTRNYIHQRLSYRYVQVEDGTAARSIEAAVRSGVLGAKPLLNPAP